MLPNYSNTENTMNIQQNQIVLRIYTINREKATQAIGRNKEKIMQRFQADNNYVGKDGR